MNLFNIYLKDKNIDNETDSGMIFNEPIENNIINKKLQILKLYENKNININNLLKNNLKTKYISNERKKDIIYNFINLINENNNFKINLIKYSLNTLIEINNKELYLMSFYTEFSDTEYIRPFNIFFIIILDKNDIEINLRDKIVYIDILGTKPYSDISFGTDYELLKGKMINIFKEDPLKLILNQTTINNYLNNKEYVSKFSYERGFPKKKFETIKSIYMYPKNKDNFKIKIGNKCMTDNNNNINFNNCEISNNYKIIKNKIINKDNQCLSLNNNNVKFISINNNNNNKILDENEKKENEKKIIEEIINEKKCTEIKFRKYGSMEINELNKCLDNDLKIKNCNETNKIFFN